MKPLVSGIDRRIRFRSFASLARLFRLSQLKLMTGLAAGSTSVLSAGSLPATSGIRSKQVKLLATIFRLASSLSPFASLSCSKRTRFTSSILFAELLFVNGFSEDLRSSRNDDFLLVLLKLSFSASLAFCSRNFCFCCWCSSFFFLCSFRLLIRICCCCW